MSGERHEAEQLLEINLISAQGLKEPVANVRRTQTYAMVWIDPSNKFRTRIDRLGAENPIWNEKFFFRVSPHFLSSETSGVSIEIYAVSYLKDHLIGTVRFLVSNFLPTALLKAPSLIALQIRRPSGMFRGVLNLSAMVMEASDLAANTMASAGAVEESSLRRRIRRLRRPKSVTIPVDNGKENAKEKAKAFPDSSEYSDEPDSTASSPIPASSPLKDWNGIQELARKNHVRSASDGGGFLCCFLTRPSGIYRP